MASSTRGGKRREKPQKGTTEFRVGAREGSLEQLRTFYDKEGDQASNAYRAFTEKYSTGGEVRQGDVRDNTKRGKCY
jgi:hypothetical protein